MLVICQGYPISLANMIIPSTDAVVKSATNNHSAKLFPAFVLGVPTMDRTPSQTYLPTLARIGSKLVAPIWKRFWFRHAIDSIFQN